MTIIEALLGEHGALCALFDRIEALAQNAELPDLKLHAGLIESTVISHADLEDELLRPEIQRYLPLTAGPTDHEQIRAGLRRVGAAVSADEARRCLPENIGANARAFSEGRSIGFVFARRRLSSVLQKELAGNGRASGEYRLFEVAVCGTMPAPANC